MALRPEDTLKLRIRPRQLALLVALDAQRNLRRAAAAVSISQPAATKLLAQLEADLGLPLFERSARGMAPTAYGATMIRHAQVVRGVERLGMVRAQKFVLPASVNVPPVNCRLLAK